MKLFSRGTRVAKSTPRPDLALIEERSRTLREFLPITPLTPSASLGDELEREIYMKWDNKLKTGSFKERGALNFLLSLDERERKRGVSVASAGNHALAVSYHASRLEIPCRVFMPKTAPLVKIEATRRFGAEVSLDGRDFDEAYETAVQFSSKSGMTLVPAFDHHRIIAGQGTAAIEMLEQLESFDSVVVSVGGGGLISGIALALKTARPEVYIVGVQSEWAVRGKSQELHGIPGPLYPGTIADGIAVKRTGTVTGPIVSEHVDQLVTVSEEQIAQAIVKFLTAERTVVEGACAAALAGLYAGCLPAKYKRTIVFVGGSNIDMNMLSRVIDQDLKRRSRLTRLRISAPDRPGSLAMVTEIFAGCGANVLETFHDRSFSSVPSNVDITFLLEVRNADHKQSVVQALNEAGIEADET